MSKLKLLLVKSLPSGTVSNGTPRFGGLETWYVARSSLKLFCYPLPPPYRVIYRETSDDLIFPVSYLLSDVIAPYLFI
jgi:hypothetical protein